MDVVPVGDLDLWDSDPFKVIEKEGKLFGRGVEDNQHGIVSSFAAAWAYISLGIKPKHTIKLLFVADEEVGSEYGVIWLLKNTNIFKKEDLILIPDGGDPLGEIIMIAEKSIMWIEFNIIGKQCHASIPHTGNNTYLVASHLIVKLHQELHSRFNKENELFSPKISTFVPTMHKTNEEGINTMPGIDTFYFDCRVIPDYSLIEILEVIDEICNSFEEEFSVKIIYDLKQFIESPSTDKNTKIVKLLSQSLKEAHGIDSTLQGLSGETVASTFRIEGFNPVVWSSLDYTAHTPNEYCIINNLIKDAQTLAVLFSK